MLGRYCLLVSGTHVDYNIVHNLLGEFLLFMGQLYVPQNLVAIILNEYHDACGYFG